MIGLWVARFTDDQRPTAQLTKWHLVESEIEDRKITRCGRALRDIEGTALAPLVTPPSMDVTCRQCNPGAPATPGDEPLTE